MIYFLLAAIVIALDQITKFWIIANFSMYESKVIIQGFFNLVYVTNKGAAFSMLAQIDSPFRHYFFLGVGLFACVGLTVANFIFRKENTLYSTCLGLIAGGAIGNLIDRIIHGAVVDFLDVYYKGYHWPAFNVADSAICVGVVMFLFLNLKTNKNKASI